VKSLGRYFAEKYSEISSDEHIAKIVKICQTHCFHSITKLAKGDISKGITNFLFIFPNWEEICELFRGMPGHPTLESYDAAMSIVRVETVKPNTPKALANWQKHKESNPWVIKCLCYPLTAMKSTDWIETSFTTNIAESAYALSQKYGKQLTLISAIQARKLDSQYFELDKIIQHSGVNVTYGNRSATGRACQSLTCQKAKSCAETTKKAKKHETTEKILQEARSL